MGCSQSKSEEVTRPDDVNPKLLYDSRPTAPGVFSSDVKDKSRTARCFSEVLVTQNHSPVNEVYALDQGIELGRGACGTVMVVKKISTGAPARGALPPSDGAGRARAREPRPAMGPRGRATARGADGAITV